MNAFNRNRFSWAINLGLCLSILSCAPTVKLSTPEAIRIDVNMKVDVKTSDQPKPSPEKLTVRTPQESRRLRMAEVQNLKNDRVIGEGRDGFLAVVNAPQDEEYRSYAQRIVQEENADRQAIFQRQAETEGKPVATVASEFAKRAVGSSFPGELVQGEDGAWKR